MNDDAPQERFETDLRAALATLARDAVPDTETLRPVADRPAGAGGQRRPGRVLVALVAAIAVVALSATVGIVVGHRPVRPARIESPSPSISIVPPAPLGPRADQMAVFTGREVIIWGGHYQPATGTAPPVASAADPRVPNALGDGAAFDIVTARWRRLPTAPITARYGAVAAWTGSEMLVVGGLGAVPAPGNGASVQGAAYDPAHNRWRRIPDAPVCVSVGVWVRTRLVVGGNCSATPFRLASFDPHRNAWTALPDPPDATQLAAVSGTLYAWNGGANRGARFDASAGKWFALPALPEPRSLDTVAAAFRGNLAVIGPISPTSPGVAVDVLGPGASVWRHFDSGSSSPPAVPEVASARDVLVWNQGVGYAWIAGDLEAGTVEIAHVANGPASLDRVSETLLAIGARRVFVWGGQSIPNGASGTSQPSADGAILDLP
ncbi:MAG TPA: hypothetical protein VGP92_04445 [Acidimicrobiia bacterium]|nr:hypothetical protein [Acidimicrobiia bacterium]